MKMYAFLLLALLCAMWWVYIPRNKKFKVLDDTLPDVQIRGAYFINMDESKKRKERFLAAYNGQIPMQRIAGVKVESSIGRLGKGTRGCALAHAKAMKEVATKTSGWYLICEDDCVGDFSKLEHNIILRNIVSLTNKQFINLGRNRWSAYSLSDVNLCLQAYLITPAWASKTCDIIINSIDGPKALPVDELVVRLYRTPRFFGQSGDGSGCHVALFDALGESDITHMGR